MGQGCTDEEHREGEAFACKGRNSIIGGVHHFEMNCNPGIYDPKRQNAVTAMIATYISLEYLFIFSQISGCKDNQRDVPIIPKL